MAHSLRITQGTHQVRGFLPVSDPHAYNPRRSPSAGGFPISPVRSPQGVAINGAHRTLGQLGHRFHPVGDAVAEPLQVQHSEYPAECIRGQDPVGQLQELVKPFPLGLAGFRLFLGYEAVCKE